MNIIALSWLDVAVSALPLLGLALLFWVLKLRMTRTLVIGAFRTWLQLTLVGFVLKGIFDQARLEWTLLFALVMLGVGTYEVMRRQKHWFKGGQSVIFAVLGLMAAGFTVTLYALLVIVGVKPWWSPQYAIPLLGMILGNTMTGIALGMDTFTGAVWKQRAVIENRLALGEAMSDALADCKRESIRTAMMPILNSLAICGVVSLPGMMTGQILSGSDPSAAVRYQMMIMYMIAAGAGMGSVLTVHLIARRLTDARDRLRLDRLLAGDDRKRT
jgi:putative ABC transport system permease protein